MVCVWGALGFLVGLRYILIHQAEDLENDIKSGTRTFVKKNGGSVRLLIYLCLGLEGIFLLLLFLWNLKAGWQLALLAVYLLQLCIAGGTIRFLYKENWLTSFLCVPLEDLYNFYLPPYSASGPGCRKRRLASPASGPAADRLAAHAGEMEDCDFRNNSLERIQIMREINFSIVIPTWKRAGLVERLLASLDADRKQYQYGKTEVLVIDNSQGEEKERIEKACGAYRARYIEGVESVRKKRNLGITLAPV